MNVDLKITGEVQSLHLAPGDCVIVTIDSAIATTAAFQRIRDTLAKEFPDNRVIVLANGLRISKAAA